jgi:hypothetical protein
MANTKTKYPTESELLDEKVLHTINYSKFKKISNLETNIVIPCSPSQVLFYSRFESGNLLRAVRRMRVKQETNFCGMVDVRTEQLILEYDLYLQPDTSSDGHMHWFYFQAFCQKISKGKKIKINIRNLVRNKSLFNEGMLPRICFQNHSQELGWHVDPKVT